MSEPTALIQLAAAQLTRRISEKPSGVWIAPGRANLIGEHTDYNNGFVLPIAINRHTAAAVRLRTDRTVTVTSGFAPNDAPVSVQLDSITPDALAGWSAYPLGVVWALGEFGAALHELPGVDIHLESDVPVGAGLSSSAAIECATAVALNDLWQLGYDRNTLARVGQRAENVAVGAPTGIMDQSASLLGETDHAVFLDCETLHSSTVPLGLAAAELELLIIDTTVSHSHATGGYASRRAACERGAAALDVASLRALDETDLPRAQQLLDDETYRRVRHVITENQRVQDTVRLLGTQGPTALGPLFAASHASMRDDFEISVPELDLAVSASVAAGAIAARMTGGGFGGAAIAILPASERAHVQAEVLRAFAEAGYATPTLFAVTAAAGARKATEAAER